MSPVAQQLSQARMTQGLTVSQVAEVTKIRTDHIEALEMGNYEVFSAPVYIRGFVRTYSRLLKLDEASLLAALDAELHRSDKFSEPPPLTDRPHTLLDKLTLFLAKASWRRSRTVAGLILVLLVVFAGYYGWRRFHKPADPLAGLAPGLYQPPANTGDYLPVPPAK